MDGKSRQNGGKCWLQTTIMRELLLTRAHVAWRENSMCSIHLFSIILFYFKKESTCLNAFCRNDKFLILYRILNLLQARQKKNNNPVKSNAFFMNYWCQWLSPNSCKPRQNTYLLQTDCCLPGVQWARQVEIITELLVQLVARLKWRKRAFSNSCFFFIPFFLSKNTHPSNTGI